MSNSAGSGESQLVGCGVGVGAGVAVGSGTGVGSAVGIAVGTGSGVAVDRGAGVSAGAGGAAGAVGGNAGVAVGVDAASVITSPNPAGVGAGSELQPSITTASPISSNRESKDKNFCDFTDIEQVLSGNVDSADTGHPARRVFNAVGWGVGEIAPRGNGRPYRPIAGATYHNLKPGVNRPFLAFVGIVPLRGLTSTYRGDDPRGRTMRGNGFSD